MVYTDTDNFIHPRGEIAVPPVEKTMTNKHNAQSESENHYNYAVYSVYICCFRGRLRWARWCRATCRCCWGWRWSSLLTWMSRCSSPWSVGHRTDTQAHMQTHKHTHTHMHPYADAHTHALRCTHAHTHAFTAQYFVPFSALSSFILVPNSILSVYIGKIDFNPCPP